MSLGRTIDRRHLGVLLGLTYALSSAGQFSTHFLFIFLFEVIVVNDADMDNNGKVEFSIKQDQPTFGIFSKAGFSSNLIAYVSCPIKRQRLILTFQ